MSTQRLTATAATALLAALVLATPSAASLTTDTADVVGQGPAGPVVAADGATIQRNDTGMSVKLAMPTPEHGTYDYPPGNQFQPDGAHPGHPEAFSLWVFVFNFPELCSGPCNSDDLGNTPAKGGAFSGGGHLVGNDTLRLAGRVTTNSDPFVGSELLAPRTAEVHLAVAPHGELQPNVMPDQTSTPIGSPPYWWHAQFPAH